MGLWVCLLGRATALKLSLHAAAGRLAPVYACDCSVASGEGLVRGKVRLPLNGADAADMAMAPSSPAPASRCGVGVASALGSKPAAEPLAMPRGPSSPTSLTTSWASLPQLEGPKLNQSLVPSMAPSHPSGAQASSSMSGTTSLLSLYAYSASVRHAWLSLYSRDTQMSTTAAHSTARAMASRHEPDMSFSSIHTWYPVERRASLMRCTGTRCAWQYEIMTWHAASLESARDGLDAPGVPLR
mmetsp:Transcript_21987/g.68444  ORF Transcript_21987/g.68444 Transcript_21987/m.68444 type:complete len:242 (-) Transcript_21987:73-798(-)